jgi:hypothetical protein
MRSFAKGVLAVLAPVLCGLVAASAIGFAAHVNSLREERAASGASREISRDTLEEPGTVDFDLPDPADGGPRYEWVELRADTVTVEAVFGDGTTDTLELEGDLRVRAHLL